MTNKNDTELLRKFEMYPCPEWPNYSTYNPSETAIEAFFDEDNHLSLTNEFRAKTIAKMMAKNDKMCLQSDPLRQNMHAT